MPHAHDAWHEAGHALAAHLLGGTVRELSIESDDDAFDAHVRVDWPLADAAEDARRGALVALAGPVAELAYRREDALDDPSLIEAWQGDCDEADACLRVLHPDGETRDRARRALLHELHAFFDDPVNYDALARIADALDAHGTLDDVLFSDALAQ